MDKVLEKFLNFASGNKNISIFRVSFISLSTKGRNFKVNVSININE